MLELRTFGGLSIEANGAPPTGAAAQRKTLALLALLARHPRGLSRDKVIAYLWPETDAAHGRSLLRQACYALRRDLDEDKLLLGSTELRLNPAAVTSDVQAFDDALQRGELARAVDRYGGSFLDGFYLSEASEFERWVSAERAQLEKQCRDALATLAKEAAARGDHRAAADWWRRLTALDPLSSQGALGLMTALVAAGESAEAIKHAAGAAAGAPPSDHAQHRRGRRCDRARGRRRRVRRCGKACDRERARAGARREPEDARRAALREPRLPR